MVGLKGDLGYRVLFSVVKARPSKRPFSVLLRGPAGCGKTFSAIRLGHDLGCQVVFFQCTPGIREDQLVTGLRIDPDSPSGVRETVGPLWEAALHSEKGVVLLVLDEWDKTPARADSILLGLLDDGRVQVHDKLVRARSENLIVVLTSNDERELSTPLLSRLVSFWVDYPDTNEMRSILQNAGCKDEDLELLVSVMQATVVAKLWKPASIRELLQAAHFVKLLPYRQWLTAFVLKADDLVETFNKVAYEVRGTSRDNLAFRLWRENSKEAVVAESATTDDPAPEEQEVADETGDATGIEYLIPESSVDDDPFFGEGEISPETDSESYRNDPDVVASRGYSTDEVVDEFLPHLALLRRPQGKYDFVVSLGSYTYKDVYDVIARTLRPVDETGTTFECGVKLHAFDDGYMLAIKRVSAEHAQILNALADVGIKSARAKIAVELSSDLSLEDRRIVFSSIDTTVFEIKDGVFIERKAGETTLFLRFDSESFISWRFSSRGGKLCLEEL